jgi:hypothetical protein
METCHVVSRKHNTFLNSILTKILERDHLAPPLRFSLIQHLMARGALMNLIAHVAAHYWRRLVGWWQQAVHPAPLARARAPLWWSCFMVWYIWKQHNAAVFDSAWPNIASLHGTIRTWTGYRRRQGWLVTRGRFSWCPALRSVVLALPWACINA